MNNRIFDLAQKSISNKFDRYESAYENQTPLWTFTDIELKRFAELIIKENALTAGLMETTGRRGIGAQILDNYGIGVEE
jgi:hypothetical protein